MSPEPTRGTAREVLTRLRSARNWFWCALSGMTSKPSSGAFLHSRKQQHERFPVLNSQVIGVAAWSPAVVRFPLLHSDCSLFHSIVEHHSVETTCIVIPSLWHGVFSSAFACVGHLLIGYLESGNSFSSFCDAEQPLFIIFGFIHYRPSAISLQVTQSNILAFVRVKHFTHLFWSVVE